MALRLPNSSLGQVGGKQERFFCRVPVPGDDSDRMQRRVDPADEAQAPIGGIQADDTRTDGVEAYSPFQEWASERRIMDIGGGEEKKDGQAGATTEQGMHSLAA
jgi:hypothetical protein